LLAAAPALAGPKDDHISGSDLNCLALNVYREARNQPAEGQLAVAHVTINRFEASDLPTICDVVFKPGNFSWTHDPKLVHQWPKDDAAWDRAQRIAHKALADPKADPVKGSTYFHSAATDPNWAPSLVRVGKIGDHVFYKTRNGAAPPAPRAAAPPVPRALAAATPPN
jgi:spore germination cell wall hydrolase CwlJ-like protein